MKQVKQLLVIWLSAGISACAGVPKDNGWTCSRQKVGPGPEDFAIHTSTDGSKHIIISSIERRQFGGGKESIGRLQTLALNRDGSFGSFQDDVWVGIAPPNRKLLNPVGMSLIKDAGTNESKLYLISTDENGDGGIEQITINNDTFELTLGKRLESALLKKANDVQALPDGHIYTTIPGHPCNSVIHYNSQSEEWKATDKPNVWFANGVANKGSGMLFVADFWGGDVKLLRRDTVSGNLDSELCAVDIEGHPDNLMWAEDNNNILVIAAHQSFFRTACHLLGLCETAPSRIITIDISKLDEKKANCGLEPKTEYEDSGSIIKASSTATIWDEVAIGKRRMLISQLIDGHVAICSREL
jgi:hypothetical protein